MVAGLTNNSRFLAGTETVSFRVVDSATAFSVEHVLCGELTWKQLQQFATLGIEGQALSIELDKADLDEVEAPRPIVGSRIQRTATDDSKWRVQAVVYDHVIGVYRCICSEIR